MEGWDCALDGNPTDNTVRRWQRFGRSGAKLIWGGEAAAVSQDGRANPNQLLVASHTEKGLDQLRRALIEEYRRTAGSGDGLLIGLQLTHSGRYSRPNAGSRGEPRILYRHPILDGRLNLPSDYPVYRRRSRNCHREFSSCGRYRMEVGFRFCGCEALPRLSGARVS